MLPRHVTRRHALSGLLGTGLAASTGSLPRAGAADESLATVGVITEPKGAHLSAYFGSLQQCQGIEQVAVADPSGQSFGLARELLGAKAATLRTFSDYRQMLASLRPQLALVSLEPKNAPAAIEASLKANCHVATEKPACVRLADFQQLVQIAESGNRHLMLALGNRLGPPAQKAVELVRRGFIGKPYGTTIHLIADQTRLTRSDYQQSWRAFKDRAGGGHLIWLGIHYLDLIEYISGDRISQVSGMIQNVGGQSLDVEDASVASLQFKGGAVGTYHGGYYLDRGYQLGLTLWGSRGWLRFDPLISPLEWYSTHPAAPRGVQTFKFSLVPGTAQYLPMVQNAVDVSRGIAQPFITAAEGLHVLKVVFAIYRAAETGVTQEVADG